MECEVMECEGHPVGPYDPMGVTVYCDGSCRPKTIPSTCLEEARQILRSHAEAESAGLEALAARYGVDVEALCEAMSEHEPMSQDEAAGYGDAQCPWSAADRDSSPTVVVPVPTKVACSKCGADNTWPVGRARWCHECAHELDVRETIAVGNPGNELHATLDEGRVS
jgi:hypothetical protein